MFSNCWIVTSRSTGRYLLLGESLRERNMWPLAAVGGSAALYCRSVISTYLLNLCHEGLNNARLSHCEL